MITPDQKVTLDDTRSGNGGNGTPDKCAYCTAKTGTQHDGDCVCRTRSVVVEATIRYTIMEPESWTDYDIEFHRNDGSWCASNMIDELQRVDAKGCLCDITQFRYVGEATKDDLERLAE